MGFCFAKNWAEECAAALAVVLMFPTYLQCPIKIPHFILPPEISPAQTPQNHCYRNLFDSIDSAITLSCTDEGIESILCSVFFEPDVPCNLVGAQLCGVKSAIQSINNNPQLTALLMVERSPKVFPLWAAATWIDETSKVFEYTIKSLPPISVPVAFWTDTLQSFVQATYTSITDRPGLVSRAREYGTSFLVNPEFILPHTPSPPFGETTISNVSLEVRRHLNHDHRPIQFSTYWTLKGGKKLAALQDQKMSRFEYCLPLTHQTTDTEEHIFK